MTRNADLAFGKGSDKLVSHHLCGKGTKKNFQNLCPVLSSSGMEGALRKLAANFWGGKRTQGM